MNVLKNKIISLKKEIKTLELLINCMEIITDSMYVKHICNRLKNLTTINDVFDLVKKFDFENYDEINDNILKYLKQIHISSTNELIKLEKKHKELKDDYLYQI